MRQIVPAFIHYTAAMKATTPPAWNPVRLDARRFAEAGGHLEGERAVTDLTRLAADAHPQALALADVARSVAWQADGELRLAGDGAAPAVWLHLQAQTVLPLTCQRCLGPVETLLLVDRWYRFVATEAQAEAEDDAAEEDLLALEPRPNLLAVLEDELLMELPLVPMHEVCPELLPSSAGVLPEDADGASTARENPFQALSKLKK
jgi:uncharacterized protein